MQIYKFDTSNMRIQLWSNTTGKTYNAGNIKVSFTTKEALANVKQVLDNAINYKMTFFVLDKSYKRTHLITCLYWDTSQPINPDNYENTYFLSATNYPGFYDISSWDNAEFYAIWD